MKNSHSVEDLADLAAHLIAEHGPIGAILARHAPVHGSAVYTWADRYCDEAGINTDGLSAIERVHWALHELEHAETREDAATGAFVQGSPGVAYHTESRIWRPKL